MAVNGVLLVKNVETTPLTAVFHDMCHQSEYGPAMVQCSTVVMIRNIGISDKQAVLWCLTSLRNVVWRLDMISDENAL